MICVVITADFLALSSWAPHIPRGSFTAQGAEPGQATKLAHLTDMHVSIAVYKRLLLDNPMFSHKRVF